VRRTVRGICHTARLIVLTLKGPLFAAPPPVRHTTEIKFDTSVYRPVSFHLDYRFGSRVNFDSPDNVAPFLAGRTSVTATLTVRPWKSLRVDNTYLLLRLHNRLQSFGSMNNHIIRSKWN
jgi:hypothetical protein